MSKSLYFSFSSLRQNHSKQGGISKSTRQGQAAPWKKTHQLSFQGGEEAKTLSLPGIPVSQRNSTSLKRQQTNLKRGFFSSQWEKGLLHSLPLIKLYVFLTRSWISFQCVFSAFYKSVWVLISLVVPQPLEGLIFGFIFRRGRWWWFTCLGKSLAQGVPLEHNCLQNRLFRKGIFRLVPRDRAGPNHSQW